MDGLPYLKRKSIYGAVQVFRKLGLMDDNRRTEIQLFAELIHRRSKRCEDRSLDDR